MLFRRFSIRRLLLYVAVIAITCETMGPFLWLIVSSISTRAELLSTPPHWIPQEPTFERYEQILGSGQLAFRGATISSPAKGFQRSMINSIIIASLTTFLCLSLGVLASYSFARLRLPFKGGLIVLIVVIQMLPPIALVIPLFFIIRSLGLMDTYAALILIYSTFTITYIVWFMTGYFQTLPKEIEEAALIDGCGRLHVLFKVVLPIARPGLVAAGILSFLTVWNEFFYALIFTFSPSVKPLSVAVAEFSTQWGIDYGMMATGGVLASIPPVILAVFFQRYILSGLTHGAVRG